MTLPPLGLLPPGAVTGIGSLPFADPDEAVAFVAEHAPTVPFWPQLPSSDVAETMLSQALPETAVLSRRPGGRGYDVDPGDLDDLARSLRHAPAGLGAGQAAGLFAFARAARAGAFPRSCAVKGQLTGPLTIAWFVAAAGRPVISRPGILEALGEWVSRQAAWQVRFLETLGHPVVIFVDEPALGLVHLPEVAGRAVQVLAGVCNAVRSAGGIAGVHCCARPADFSVLRAASPDVVSFDAGDSFTCDDGAPHRTAPAARLAFGLVTAEEAAAGGDADAIFGRWLAAALETGDPAGLARRTMVTATCGLGLVDPTVAQASFRLATQVSARVRAVADSVAPTGSR